MGNRISKPVSSAAQRAMDLSESFLTDAHSGLSEYESLVADRIKSLDSEEELNTQVGAAEKETAAGRQKIADVDTQGGEAVQRTEKQQMVEQLVQGLGKVLGGILGEKEGFTADIKTQSSDFGAILAGRMKDIENKRRTAEGELQTSEQKLRDRITRAERNKEIRSSSAMELAQMKLQAGLQFYLEDSRNKQRAIERAEDQSKEKEREEQISMQALIKQFEEKGEGIAKQSETLSTLLGETADEKKGAVAGLNLATKLNLTPSEFMELNSDEKAAIVSDKQRQLEADKKVNEEIRNRLATMSKTGKLSSGDKDVMKAVINGAGVRKNATGINAEGKEVPLANGEYIIDGNIGTSLIEATAKIPAANQIVKDIAKAAYGEGWTTFGKEDSALKALSSSGDFSALTPEEKIEVRDIYQKLKKNENFQKAAMSVLSKAEKERDIKTLLEVAPGTKINVVE